MSYVPKMVQKWLFVTEITNLLAIMDWYQKKKNTHYSNPSEVLEKNLKPWKIWSFDDVPCFWKNRVHIAKIHKIFISNGLTGKKKIPHYSNTSKVLEKKFKTLKNIGFWKRTLYLKKPGTHCKNTLNFHFKIFLNTPKNSSSSKLLGNQVEFFFFFF